MPFRDDQAMAGDDGEAVVEDNGFVIGYEMIPIRFQRLQRGGKMVLFTVKW